MMFKATAGALEDPFQGLDCYLQGLGELPLTPVFKALTSVFNVSFP